MRGYPLLKPCVLKSLDVDYGPGGETQFLQPIKVPGGLAPPPTEINMTLSFTETEIMTKERMQKDSNGTDY